MPSGRCASRWHAWTRTRISGAPGTIVVREPPALHEAAAKWIRAAIGAATARGSCALALSGGSTPQPVHALLGAPPLADQVDWSRVHVYFADERAVPPLHEDSNYRAAHESLLAKVPIPPGQIHRMPAERGDDAAARGYEALLPPALDVLLLGAGPDGHTASIFPRSATLRETARRVVLIDDAPKPPPRRMTITPPVIAAARQVVMLVTGRDKAEVVARALEGPPDDQLPIQLARRGAWFLDPGAAACLADAPS